MKGGASSEKVPRFSVRQPLCRYRGEAKAVYPRRRGENRRLPALGGGNAPDRRSEYGAQCEGLVFPPGGESGELQGDRQAD